MTVPGPQGIGVRILVVGQTPPPVGGQALMIERMLGHRYDGVELFHVRMAFSQEISDAGKFQVRKVAHLGSVIARIVWTRLRRGTRILYYPPAGPNKVPVMRDIAILVSTRWLFRKTIFHFHATNLPAIYPSLARPMERLFRIAYGTPDLAIATSEFNLNDAQALGARDFVVIPNCVESLPPARAERTQRNAVARLLFVGLVTPTKGVGDLLEACAKLKERGLQFEVTIVGRPEDPAYQDALDASTHRLGIADEVNFTGEVAPSSVLEHYRAADVFVFPTRDRSESFGLVLLEAMSYSLPLVGSGEAGVRSIIRNGINGFHVDSRDPTALADAIAVLIESPELGKAMGARGRKLVEEDFSEGRFFESMQAAFISQASRP